MAITRKGYFGTWGRGKQKGVMQAALYYSRKKKRLAPVVEIPGIVYQSVQWLFYDAGFGQDVNGDYIVYDNIEGDSTRIPEPGKCYDFNGTDNLVNLTNSVIYEGTNYLKFSVGIKASKPLSNKAIVSKYYTTGSNRVYTVELTASGTIQFFISPDGTSTGVEGVVGTADFADGTYHDLIFEYDAGTVKTWIDGTLDLNDTVTITSFHAPATQPSTLWGGKQNGSPYGQYFDGKMGNLKFYDSSDNVIGWFRGDEGNSPICFDSSGNENHGTKNGTLSGFDAEDNDFISNQNDNGYNTAIYCSSNGYTSNQSTTEYGIWEFKIKKAVSSVPIVTFIADRIGGSLGSNGYSIAITTDEILILRKEAIGSITNLAYTTSSYIQNDVIYNIKITRNSIVDEYITGGIGTFAWYIKGGSFGADFVLVDVAGGFGTNPVLDNSITTSSYINIDIDSGDSIYDFKINQSFISLHNFIVQTGIFNNLFIPQDNSSSINSVLGSDLQYTGKVAYNALLTNNFIAEFDDTDDYVSGVLLDTQAYFRNDFTIEILVRPSDGKPPSNRAFWGFECVTSTDYVICRLLTTGAVRMSIQVDSVLVEATTDVIFDDGQNTNFTKIKVAVNSTTMTIYVNDVQNGSIGDMSTITLANLETASELWIGGYNRAGFLFNRIPSAFAYFCAYDNNNTKVTEYTIKEGYGLKWYDVSGNGNHGTLNNITLSTFWDQYLGSDISPDNLLNGFELYDDDATHLLQIRVPYLSDGSLITPTISGYSKISDHPAGNWHNGAETEILQYSSPAMNEADTDSDKSTNYWNLQPAQTPDPVVYSEIQGDVEDGGVPQHKIFADVSTAYQYKNILSYANILSGSDLGNLLVWLNNQDIEQLLDSEGQQIKVNGDILYVYKA